MLVTALWELIFYILCVTLIGCGEYKITINGATSTNIFISYGAELFTDNFAPYIIEQTTIKKIEKQLEATAKYFSKYCKNIDCNYVLYNIKAIVLANNVPLKNGPCLEFNFNKKRIGGCWLELDGIIWIGVCENKIQWACGILVHETMHVFEDILRYKGTNITQDESDNNHSEFYWNDVNLIVNEVEEENEQEYLWLDF